MWRIAEWRARHWWEPAFLTLVFLIFTRSQPFFVPLNDSFFITFAFWTSFAFKTCCSSGVHHLATIKQLIFSNTIISLSITSHRSSALFRSISCLVIGLSSFAVQMNTILVKRVVALITASWYCLIYILAWFRFHAFSTVFW